MSVDILQDKIRKTKCPIVVDLALLPEHLPSQILEGKTEAEAMEAYIRSLLTALKGKVPGVRFHFDQWAIMDSLSVLRDLTDFAAELGFYVLMDGPAVLSPWAAQRAVSLFDSYRVDSMILCPYAGSDVIRPFLDRCKKDRSVFLAVRTANKSAVELQDMMTGSRLVHVAAADHVKRLGEPIVGKCGYSQLGALTAATSANAVMGLRSKYNRMFLLVDGLDYPGGNGKNCSYGFDRFGHGCAISVGPAITAAWKEGENLDPVEAATQAVERIRNNMARYITIL